MKKAWIAVPAVFVLFVGCAGDAARVSPSGTGEALLGAGWAAPGAYQFEAAVYVDKLMTGAGVNPAIGIGFTYFFKAIEDTDKPYGLQEFYGSEGKVALTWADLTEEITTDFADNWALEAEYTLPPMDGACTVHAQVAGGDPDILWGLGVDYQALDDLNVALDYGAQGDASDIVLGAEYVLGVGRQYLDLGLSLDIADDGTASGLIVGFEGAYCLTKELSLGLMLEAVTGDLGDAFNYGLSATYYSGPVLLTVGYTLNDGGPNALGARIGYRF